MPVITSGYVADDIHDQIAKIQAMEKTGANALILFTNRLTREHESDECWIKNYQMLLDKLYPQTALGLYECPYLYKHLLSEKIIEFCLSTGRFYFIKDTCCNVDILARQIKLIQDSTIKIYNANTTTLIESLRKGAAGYSGIMANFHPKLYVWLCENYLDARAAELAASFSIMSLIEGQYYSVNAKYYLASVMHLPIGTTSRQQNNNSLTDTFKKETFYLSDLIEKIEKHFY